MAHGLFVEPFYGGSHRAFLDGLVDHSRHSLTLLTLPDGEWRRRMRRGAQELATSAPPGDVRPDFMVASDMLDLPTYLALTRRWSAEIPVLYYLHENQLTYPRIKGTKLDSWFGAMNYLSARAADRVAFNSGYHRDSFLGALREMEHRPNNWLVPAAVATIEAKSVVLAPGVDLAWLDGLRPAARRPGPPRLLWNHRWEFDKSPDLFARTVRWLASGGHAFELILAGEPGLNPSPAFAELRAALPGRVIHFGYAATREAYGRLIWDADIVVSTTQHEFFGIGMVEALYAGCWPVAPRRYNYPALVAPEVHDLALWDDEPGLREQLAEALARVAAGYTAPAVLRTAVTPFAWPSVVPAWDAALDGLVRR
ncbi:MAG: DUF3524 domain-containing protein [Dehalococcoidia bacterium]